MRGMHKITLWSQNIVTIFGTVVRSVEEIALN